MAQQDETKSDAMSNDQFWEKEIDAAEKRLENFHTQGDKVIEKFLDEADKGSNSRTYRLNLFHSNIITMRSLLFGSTPKVDVRRKFFDPKDDPARVASLIFSRVLNCNVEEPGEDFNTVLRSCLDDRLLPGLGQARVRYVVETEEYEREQEEGYEGEPEMEERMAYEDCEIDYVHWRDFLWGWGRNWKSIDWVGFRTYVDKEEAKKAFDEEVVKEMQFTQRNLDNKKTSNSDPDKSSPWGQAEVIEIWCKSKGKVYWFSPDSKKVIKEQDDPLELDGFFPCPPPMMANTTSTLLIPKADFIFAQDLYDEIDNLQRRIAMITKAIKVVGAYNKDNAALGRILNDLTENEMVPVDNWSQFAEKNGIAGNVDWLPIKEMAETLTLLRQMRDETVNLLFQVTGMSDIMRGAATQTGVSATEQALKAKFGSVRIQALQDAFAKFATDLQKLRAEVIAKHFDDETIIQQSNLGFHEENVGIVQQAIELVHSPQRDWRIEIRPESVAMVDYAQIKSERVEYLTALSTYVQSAQALIKQAPEMGTMLLQLMRWGLSGFKGSNEIEGVVDTAIDKVEEQLKKAAMQPPPPSPEQVKADAKKQELQMKGQMDMQKEQFKAEQEMQKMRQQLQADMMTLMQTFKNELQLLLQQQKGDIEGTAVQTEGRVREKVVQLQGDILQAEIEAGRDNDVD